MKRRILSIILFVCVAVTGIAQDTSKDAIIEIGVLGDAKNFTIRTYYSADVQNPAKDITWKRLNGNRVAFIIVPAQEYMVSKEGFAISKIKLSKKDPLFGTYGADFSSYNDFEKWALSSLGSGDDIGKANVIDFTLSRNIDSADVGNTISCTTSSTLTLTLGFDAMAINDTINLESLGVTLTVTGAVGVTVNGVSAGNIVIGNDLDYIGGILRKTGTNSYVVL